MNQRLTDPISPWLGAYLDGELTGDLRRQVEEHLATCANCRAELLELRALSRLLKDQPLPASPLSDDAFAARVRARLPQSQSPWTRRAMKAAWQGAPLALVAGWVFTQAVLWLAGLLLMASRLVPGARETLARLLPFTAPAYSGGAGLLDGLLGLDLLHGLTYGPLNAGLSLAGWASPLMLVYLAALTVTAGLFFAWLATWWVARRRAVVPVS